jgi:signal transduction histidine kinase
MPPLRTVRVPEGFVPPFAQAEEVVSRYFSLRKDDPEHGSIEIAGERYVLVRAASLSVEFFAMVQDLYGPGREPEADEFARNILYDLAHAIGRSDAQNFHTRMGLSDPIARLSAGPVHFAHTGWAFVDIDPSSHASSDGEFHLLYEHPYSFEADAWLRSGKQRNFTACIMNAGYSSGWCEASFGLDLVSTEVLCRARGDASCRFIMAPPHRIEEHVRTYLDADEATAPTPHTYQIPDFFARKRMEEELRKAHGALERRVAERTAELTQSNERLRSEMMERQRAERRLAQTNKLEALGRLAGGIAHDFNNLMAIVIANAGLLERRLPSGEPARAFVDEILGASARAAQLTRQLLAFGRPVVRAQEPLQPGPIVGELTRMLGRVIGEEITLTTRLDQGAGFVEIDRGQLEQIVLNLVVNGRDAMPVGGTITIETVRATLDAARAAAVGVPPGDFVRLTVSDTGTGMDEHVLTHLFDPFFTTKAGDSGTGLGLATVYGIVRQRGGAIDVHSAPGAGSRFDVYLPRVEPPPPPAPEADAPAVARGAETVLLAEDQERLRAVVGDSLRDFGYTVLEAEGPVEALRLASEHPGPIDLLLSDVIMPGMRGPELAQQILGKRPGIKILLMSGYVDDAGLHAMSGLSDAAMIAKPFTHEELARKVREVLRR